MKTNRFGQAAVLSSTQLDQLIAALPAKHHQVLAEVCRRTGCRISEGRQLQWQSISKTHITFPKTITKAKLKSRTIPQVPKLREVLAQWRHQAKILFDVPASAFTPPPKVTSSIVQLVPRAEPLAVADQTLLQQVAAAAFGQRRKMIRTALRQLSDNSEGWIAAADLDPTARAETLEIGEFCCLARHLPDFARKTT